MTVVFVNNFFFFLMNVKYNRCYNDYTFFVVDVKPLMVV